MAAAAAVLAGGVAGGAGATLLTAAPAQASTPGASGKILFTDRGDLFTLTPGAARASRLTATGDTSDAQWSPDGRQIAFSGTRAGSADVYVMAADGTGLRRVTTSTAAETSPAWSPDGRQIAFVSDRTGTANVYRMRSTAPYGTPTAVTRASAGGGAKVAYRDVDWSPDGRTMLVTRTTTRQYTPTERVVQLVSAGTGAVLQANLGFGQNPTWSPSGTAFAYENWSDSDYGLWISKARPNGTGAADVTPAWWDVPADPDGTTPLSTTYSPVWSPDGTSVAHYGETAQGIGLHVVRVDGSGSRLLLGTGVPVSWQPL